MDNKFAISALLVGTIAMTQIGRPPQRGGFGGGRFNGGATGGNCIVPGYRGDGTEDTSAPRNIDQSSFIYARLRYHPVNYWRLGTREIPWHHDYPDGDTMFSTLLGKMTTTHSDSSTYQIVDIDSKELFSYPFAYLSEPGYLDLRPQDAQNLREYLDRGGFLLIDDFRGNEFDDSELENLVRQLRKVYPDRNLTKL